ncbi:MAG: methyl-accepting chemotaxis protein [Planctomycetota bacterium]|jgi:methyl-accepting chemotaxis protein|nr:methyl-accepting chemotaxis protein [Planctomycetota bacterium]
MGFKKTVLLLFGILAFPTLGQMAISWRLTEMLGRGLVSRSHEIAALMLENVADHEGARLENTLMNQVIDLKLLLNEYSQAIRLARDFFAAQARIARLSPENTEIARGEVAEFCRTAIQSRLPRSSGIGATFEPGRFSPFLPYFMPFAFWEEGGINYDDEVTLPPDRNPDAPLTDREREDIFRHERELDYYVASLPAGHDRAAPLPEQVNWTDIYLDEITGRPTLSATAPINLDNQAAGVAFLDLPLTDLRELAERSRLAISPNTGILVFAAASGAILASSGISDPQEKKGGTLAELSFGREILDLFGRLSGNNVLRTSIRSQGAEYALIVLDVDERIGMAALTPEAEIMADSLRAGTLLTDMEAFQKQEMRKVALAGGISLAILLLAAGATLLSLIHVANRLIGSVAAVAREAAGIGSVADTMADLSRSLADGAASQVATLSATSSSLEKISGQVKNSADGVRRCGEAMAGATREVESGLGLVGKMTEAMTGISESSDKIGSILNTIKAISFQTNLLSLNASVEAARAGEAGKGFAVVAEEVRNLSGRSAEAVRQTETLISNSTERVKLGARATEQLEKGFRDIDQAMSGAVRLMAGIRESTDEQNLAIGGVNTAVAELEAEVKRNDQAAGEVAAAAQKLTRQAEALNATAGELELATAGTRTNRLAGRKDP